MKIFDNYSIVIKSQGNNRDNMMINNNSLWKKKIPIDKIPFYTNNINIKWLLGNCFYFISFVKDNRFPNVNLHVKHKSPRGGSIMSRYIKKKKYKNKSKIILSQKMI